MNRRQRKLAHEIMVLEHDLDIPGHDVRGCTICHPPRPPHPRTWREREAARMARERDAARYADGSDHWRGLTGLRKAPSGEWIFTQDDVRKVLGNSRAPRPRELTEAEKNVGTCVTCGEPGIHVHFSAGGLIK